MEIKILEEARTILSNPLGRHNYFGWPSIARLPGGELVVACSGFRCGHVCPFGKAVMAVSFDEGKSYLGPWPVIDTPLDDRDAGIVPFGDNGVILTSFNNTRAAQRGWNPVREDLPEEINRRNAYYNAYLDTVTDEEEETYLGATFRLSFDGGKTFGPLFRSPVTSPHGPTALADGSLLWVGRTFSGDDSFEQTDRLEAWRVAEDGSMAFVGAVPPVEKDGAQVLACEPHVIQLEDGSLLCHFRGEGGGMFTLYQTVSTDGGVTWNLPAERKNWSKSYMMDEMCTLMGGRAAEMIVNGEPSTGALSDFERMTNMAYSMVQYYGMSDRIGPVSFYDSTGSRGYELVRPYSEKTAELMDQEVRRIIDEVQARTDRILRENDAAFRQVAELLLDKEVIMNDDLERILGPKVKPASAVEEAAESQGQPESGEGTAHE